MNQFLVFTRSDRHPWQLDIEGTFWSLASAIEKADEATADRAVVMEIGSVDALPTFTLKHVTPKTETPT